MAAPRYQDLRGADLPTRREPGVEIRLLSGSSGGVSSPTLNHVPVTAIAARGDVAALDCAANLFDIAEREFGPVDVFVNNAGMLRQAPLAESDDAMFDRLVAVNLGGMFRGMRESARRLRDGGRVHNNSTSVGGFYHPNRLIAKTAFGSCSLRII